MPVKFTAKYEKIPFDDGENYVEVRGLNLPDISALVDAHGNTVSKLFDRFTGRDPESFNTDDAAVLAGQLVTTFPAVCAHVVALAADALDDYETIAKLPIDVQIAALEKIANRTFVLQGGLGNLMETILRLMQSGNGLVAKAKAGQNSLTSMNGSTASIGK